MSIPSEALQKLALEIESQASAAQREINIVKAAIGSRQRDIRMLELTRNEVKQLDTDTKVYEGVGKMFVCKPTSAVETKLSGDIASIASDVGNLTKKLNYLETTHKNSRAHIEKIIGSSART